MGLIEFKKEVEECDNAGLKEFGKEIVSIIEKENLDVNLEGKSLNGLMDEMYKIAKAGSKNNRYCIGPNEAVEIAKKYFGIDGVNGSAAIGTAKGSISTNNNVVDINILDLL